MDLPFLYLTRTIIGPSKISTKALRRVPRKTPRYRCLHQQTQHETQDQTSFFREKADAVAAKIGRPEHSTITREEHRAFDNLRRLAGQLRQQSQRHDSTPDPGLLDTNPQAILALFTPSITSANANEIKINEICQQYMSSLSEQFKKDLKSPQGDIAIWQTLHSRVYPLLALLKDPEKTPKAELLAAHQALPISKSFAQPSKPAKASGNDLKDTKSPLATPNSSQLTPLPILTRLYPTSLLLSLRLLTLSHPLSPLTPSLLSYTRSLGSTSYILGTNTHFYNTFLYLRWNTHSSLREICGLLGEMERGAVEFDRGTWRVLRGVGEERYRDMVDMQQETGKEGDAGVEDGVSGSRGGKWWLRPEQMQWWPKVEEWKGIIARKLEEQGAGEVIREGPPTETMGQTESLKVWL